MKYPTSILLWLAVCSMPGLAQTTVSGPINGQTWTVAGSPYVVTGPTDIVLLTIEPGVEVQVQGSYEINVVGTLTAVGTQAQPIRFTKTIDNPDGGWLGMRLTSANPATRIEWAEISEATFSGLVVDNTLATLKNLTFKQNRHPDSGGAMQVLLTDGLVLENILFENNQIVGGFPQGVQYYSLGGALYLDGTSANTQIVNCEFRANRSTLASWGNNHNAFGGAVYAGGTAEFSNCRFIDNQIRLDAAFLLNNHPYGGAIYAAAGVTIRNSELIRNSTHLSAHNNTPMHGGNIYVAAPVTLFNTVIYGGDIEHSGSGAGERFGSALYLAGNQSLDAYNVTVVDNNEVAFFTHGTSTAQVHDSIFWDNNTGITSIGDIQGPVNFTHSIVTSLAGRTEPTLMVQNPVFQDANGLDFRLVPSQSNAVDAGRSDSAYNDGCLPPGLMFPRGDLGAYGGPNNCAGVGLVPQTVTPVTLTADFSATPTSGTSPLTVQFSDLSTAQNTTITEWLWDFDSDGNIDSTQQNPQYTYSLDGSYDVTLIVTDFVNSSLPMTKTSFINVGPVPTLSAAASADVTQGAAPLQVQFTDLSVAENTVITDWEWDFDGDGNIDSFDQHPSYTYNNPGSYQVNFTVRAAGAGLADSLAAGQLVINVLASGSLWTQGLGNDIYRENGNVGIGTTTPMRDLHIVGSGDQIPLIETTDNGATAGLEIANSGTVNYSWRLAMSGFSGFFNIIDGTTSQPRLTIDDLGKLGLGTNTPQQSLHVEGSNAQFIRLTTTNGFTDAGVEFQQANVGQMWRMQAHNGDGNLQIQDADSGRLFMSFDADTANQHIGVGHNDPQAELHVSGSNAQMVRVTTTTAAGAAGLELEQSSTGEMWQLRMSNSDGNLSLTDGDANLVRMTVDQQGRVGIGTTNPQATLDVNGPIYQRGSELHADYVFAEDYNLLSIEAQQRFMASQKHLPAVPARAVDQDGREVLNVGAHRRGMLEELEKAHLYIGQLYDMVQKQQTQIEFLQKKLDSQNN